MSSLNWPLSIIFVDITSVYLFPIYDINLTTIICLKLWTLPVIICLPLFNLMYVGVPTYKPSFLGTACLIWFIVILLMYCMLVLSVQRNKLTYLLTYQSGDRAGQILILRWWSESDRDRNIRPTNDDESNSSLEMRVVDHMEIKSALISYKYWKCTKLVPDFVHYQLLWNQKAEIRQHTLQSGLQS